MRAVTVHLLGALALAWPAAQVLADPPAQDRFELQETFLLGIAEHELDADTEITGWRLNHSWYVGRRKGEDEVSLVWQGRHEQVSISTDGIRFTRRF